MFVSHPSWEGFQNQDRRHLTKLTLTSYPPACRSEAFQTAWKPFLTSYNAIATVAGVWTPKMRKCTSLFVSEKNPQALIAARSESPNTSPLVGSPNSEVWIWDYSRRKNATAQNLLREREALLNLWKNVHWSRMLLHKSICRACCCTSFQSASL